MSSFNPSQVLLVEDELLLSDLELTGKSLVGHLFANKVLTRDQMQQIGAASAKENAKTDTDMVASHEPMDEDTKKDGDVNIDEEERPFSEDEDSEEDNGHPMMNLEDIKTAPKIPHLSVRVTVVEKSNTEIKHGKEQFMAVVADKTSAVDICVRNKDLFNKFEVDAGLILENITWSGNVIFVNEESTATRVERIEIPPSLAQNAFGQERIVSIKRACALTAKSWVALKGKIVKQSVVTKEYAYGKLLMAHRQIKLKDRSGSVNVHVWGDDAVNLKAGDVIRITGCKIQKFNPEPQVTTTRKTRVVPEELSQSEFQAINIDQRFQTGTLEGIDVEVYTSCPKPGCYHFKLDLDDDNFCDSCEVHVREPVPYATARIHVLTPRKRIRTLKVLWPQLRQLYTLFDIQISLESGMSTPADEFRHLRHQTVQFQTCGTVIEFRL